MADALEDARKHCDAAIGEATTVGVRPRTGRGRRRGGLSTGGNGAETPRGEDDAHEAGG